MLSKLRFQIKSSVILMISPLFSSQLQSGAEMKEIIWQLNGMMGDGERLNAVMTQKVCFIYMKVCFLFFFLNLLSAPLSPQRPASWGYGGGERGQWDHHPGLLATPSRRGAERGGPGIQGNKKHSQQLHQVGASGTLNCRDTQRRDKQGRRQRR